MRLSRLASVIWLAACVGAPAQHLAPEVLMLSRIKSFLRYEFAHLPNYTCLETVSRFQRQAEPASKFKALDTLRLEVAYSNRREWFGAPGRHDLSVDSPVSLARGAGLIANGVFATTLHNLFLADGASFTPQGESTIGGRNAIKFDYRFPNGSTIAKIKLLGGSGAVNEEGSVWIDPKSFDLLRVDGRVTEIPPSLPLASMEFTVVYGRARIGEFDALLAQYADLHMIQSSGVEDFDRMDFTHCKMFHAESTLNFDSEEKAAVSPVEPARRRLTPEPDSNLPAALRVVIDVDSRITDKDAAGKLIQGHVAGNVRQKGQVVLEDGTAVLGRIRRLQRDADGRFVVSLEFTEVQTRGATLRFYADLVMFAKSSGVLPVPRERVYFPNPPAGISEIKLPDLPGIAAFLVEGRTFDLPPGLRTVWRTRALLPDER